MMKNKGLPDGAPVLFYEGTGSSLVALKKEIRELQIGF